VNRYDKENYSEIVKNLRLCNGGLPSSCRLLWYTGCCDRERTGQTYLLLEFVEKRAKKTIENISSNEYVK
jgi:hypothetical protein